MAAALKNLKETIKTEEKKQKQLQKSVAEDEKALGTKRVESDKLQGTYDGMRAAATADNEAVTAAEARLQAISTGMYAAEDGGEDATLQEQLISKFFKDFFFILPKLSLKSASNIFRGQFMSIFFIWREVLMEFFFNVCVVRFNCAILLLRMFVMLV